MHRPTTSTVSFLIVLAFVSLLTYVLFEPYLSALFIAVNIATLLYNFYERILKYFRGKEFYSALITTIIAFLVIVIPVLVVIGLITDELFSFVTALSTEGTAERITLINAIEKIKEINVVERFAQNPEALISETKIQEQIVSVGQGTLSIATKTLQGTLSIILWILIMLFTLFYAFKDGKRTVKRIVHLSPLPDKDEGYLIDRFVSMTRATFKGALIVGIIQGVLGGITLLIAGVSTPILWTMLMILLSIIPLIGPALVLIPAAIIMFLLGNIWQGIFILIVTIFISTIDNIIRPMFVGKDTQMHTFFIFFSTIGGLAVFGIVGFIAGPIIMALFLALWEIYDREFANEIKRLNEA